MSDRYVYIRKNGEPSRAVSLSMTMAAARLRVASGMVDYRLRENEEPWGPALSRPVMLHRLRNKLDAAEVGDKYRVYSEPGDDAVFKVHKVQPSLDVIDINGNHNADVYYSVILTQFPQFKPRYAGSYVCKEIAGSNTLSQHSYGNAVDFFFDSLAHQDVVADFVVQMANELNVATDGHIISRARIWENGSWHVYGGDYHSHLHVDFDPQFSGPCGVREP